jgi:hypothetical protein
VLVAQWFAVFGTNQERPALATGPAAEDVRNVALTAQPIATRWFFAAHRAEQANLLRPAFRSVEHVVWHRDSVRRFWSQPTPTKRRTHVYEVSVEHVPAA